MDTVHRGYPLGSIGGYRLWALSIGGTPRVMIPTLRVRTCLSMRLTTPSTVGLGCVVATPDGPACRNQPQPRERTHTVPLHREDTQSHRIVGSTYGRERRTERRDDDDQGKKRALDDK